MGLSSQHLGGEDRRLHLPWQPRYIVRTACENGEKAGSGKYLPQKHKGLNLDP